MQEQIDTADDSATVFDDVRIVLGETTALTLGSGGGSSEDKRYIYN